jgi:hypothetical protein
MKPNWFELLVIVFIVVLLAALLLPALFSPVRGVKHAQHHQPQDSSPLLVDAHKADQPSGQFLLPHEVIKLLEPPQSGRVYDLAFSPRRDSLVCAFALEQAAQIWDVAAKPRLISTLTPPPPQDDLHEGLMSAARPIAFSSDSRRVVTAHVLLLLQSG